MKSVIVLAIVIISIGLMVQYPHTMLNPGPLTEKHQNLRNKCLSCHEPFWGIPNDKCIACHKVSEIGKDTLASNDPKVKTDKILFHQNLSNQNCTSCHTDHKGLKPEMSINHFNHESLSEASLSNCNSCHNKPSDQIHIQIGASCHSCHNIKGWKVSVTFNHSLIKSADINNCIACHQKPVDNLHKQLLATCNNCHNTNGWKSSVTFNHSMITGTDKNNCTSCHQKPNDSYHSLFKDNCDKCHTSDKWIPSSFDHSTYFQLDENHNAKCNTCHTSNNFSSYSCYGCHEHSQNKLMEEHQEKGVSNFTNCVSCHRSGNEHDIRTNGNLNRESNQNENNKIQRSEKKKDNTKEEDDND